MIHARTIRALFALFDRCPAAQRSAARAIVFAAAGGRGLRADDVFRALSVARGIA